MADELPQTIPVALSALAELAVEWWRLDRRAAAPDAGPHARHVARRLARVLSDHGPEVLDVTGRAYEPGLAVGVIHAFQEGRAPHGSQGGDVQVAPGLLFRGRVVRNGQVVVRRKTNPDR